jgi:hypothetical protein
MSVLLRDDKAVFPVTRLLRTDRRPFVRKRPTRGGCPPPGRPRLKKKEPRRLPGAKLHNPKRKCRVTPPGLSFGRWSGPPTQIVVRVLKGILVYRKRAIGAVPVQMAHSGAHLVSATSFVDPN